MHEKNRLVLIAAIFTVLLLITGCGGDDDPVNPVTSSVGTIVVNPAPDHLNPTWILSGPGIDGNGTRDSTFSEMPVGDYTLTWGDITDHVTPVGGTQALVGDGVITFSGIYLDDSVIPGEFVAIPPASVTMPVIFTMGSDDSSEEAPHQVTLTYRFNMASNEVTNGRFVEVLQWAFDEGHVTANSASVFDALDGSTVKLLDLDRPNVQISFNDDIFSTSNPDDPVVEISWLGSAAFCDWLSLQEGMPRAYDHSTWNCNNGNPYEASGYRLPTEAEWEFACRAGSTTFFNTGDCLDAGTEANYFGSGAYFGCSAGPFLGRTANVGSYLPNKWGLFDMHGNVREWCNDWHDAYGADTTNPAGPAEGSNRVLRGGFWLSYAYFCRSANRFSNSPSNPSYSYGFRPVKTIN